MKRFRSYVVLLFALIAISQVQAQGSANGLIHAVYTKLQKAKDYSVQANIKVDMPFIRVLPVDVTIYFRQDNKLKVESKSIAIVPRQGFDQVSKMLADTNSFTAIIQGQEKLGTIQVSIVNVIPLSDTSDVILGKLWLDPLQSVIIKSQLTTRSSGTIVTEYFYGSQIIYGLPDQMIFSVDASKFRMPKNMTTEMNQSEPDKKDKSKDDKKGKIYIVLTNYQVNKGIPDSIFKE
jgi:hypothetical protein